MEDDEDDEEDEEDEDEDTLIGPWLLMETWASWLSSVNLSRLIPAPFFLLVGIQSLVEPV